jgi:hypothetical protein
MDLLWQVQATERSREADRSVAFAAGGLGWTLSHITNPLLAGWLAEDYGFPFALTLMGALMLLMAAGTKLWYRVLVTEAPMPQSA